MAQDEDRKPVVRETAGLYSDDMFMFMMMPIMMVVVMVVVLTTMLEKMMPDYPSGIAQLSVEATSEVKRYYFSPPWISFTVTNYGPADLLIDVNSDQFSPGERPIRPGATANFEMSRAVIEMIAVKAVDGDVATAAFFANR